MYQLTRTTGVTRLADGAVIPADKGNRDWLEFEAWIASGNAPKAAPDVPDLVPQVVKSGNFKRALWELGWYADVEVAARAANGLAQVLWLGASEFERDHPLVASIARAIGKDDADLDRLFRLAATY